MSRWVYDWPTESGYYWFYGGCFSGDREHPPILYYVRVRRITDRVMYVTEGHFLYKEEGAYGLWQLVDLPELPSNNFWEE